MNRKTLHTYGTLLVYGIALILCAFALGGCITAKQWSTAKSHAAEVGIAAGSGALAVATGGAAAIPIFVGGMGTAAFVGELSKPPPDVIVVQTGVDKDGNLTLPKVTFNGATKMPETHWYDFVTHSVLWTIVAIALIAYLATHPKTLRALMATLVVVEGFVSKTYAGIAARFRRKT